MTAIENQAMSVVQLQLASKRELPLSILGAITFWCRISETPCGYVDDSKTGTYLCLSRKMYSLGDIGSRLEKLIANGISVWLYKLYEYDEYGNDLEPTGKQFYMIRYAALDLRDQHKEFENASI